MRIIALLLTTLICALELSGAAVTLPLNKAVFRCQAMMSKSGMIPAKSPQFEFALTDKEVKVKFQVPYPAGAVEGVFSGEVFEFLILAK